MDVAHTLNLYCDLMEEIKVRIDAAQAAIEGKFPTHPLIAYETGYLQLRMICETIALACLVVHGDKIIDKDGYIKKTYHPEKIINALSRIHPDFYPIPGKQKSDELGCVIAVENLTDGFLTKKMLISLWSRASNKVYRGELATFKLRFNDPKPFEPIKESIMLIMVLLNHHKIALHGTKDQIWGIMHERLTGKPRAFLMAYYGPA